MFALVPNKQYLHVEQYTGPENRRAALRTSPSSRQDHVISIYKAYPCRILVDLSHGLVSNGHVRVCNCVLFVLCLFAEAGIHRYGRVRVALLLVPVHTKVARDFKPSRGQEPESKQLVLEEPFLCHQTKSAISGLPLSRPVPTRPVPSPLLPFLPRVFQRPVVGADRSCPLD